MLKLSAFLPTPSLPALRPPRRRLPARAHAISSTAGTLVIPTAPNALPNARDLASASPDIVRAGRLYRGATPSTLPRHPPADAMQFLRDTGVLLDLRSNDERRDDQLALLTAACGPDFPEREQHIGLLNKRRVVLGLARVLPSEQVRDLFVRVVTHPRGARETIVRRMDSGGLVLLNRILVEASSRAIGRALNVISNGLDTDRQVYFYCSAGKDRTGLLAALILSVLGVGEREIIHDYAKSSECWENGPYELREQYCARLEHAGLTPLNWLGAPPEVMEETLSFIRKRYGSVEDYLIHCNFPEHRMNSLRDAMLLSS